MNRLTYLFLFLASFGFTQTPITDANFQIAINTCLSTNPVDGLCYDSEYGAMPDWDVSQVTVSEGVLNILKKIFGIFSGCFSNTLRNILSKN